MAQRFPLISTPPPALADDEELRYALEWFARIPNLTGLLGQVLRESIDDVLDTYRTGRFDILGSDVGKTEKSHVGTRVEIRLIAELGVPRGKVLDMDLGNEVQVDVKHTLRSSWMVPREAVGRLCLCLRTNDRRSWYNAHLVRAEADLLGGREEGNGDRKRGLSGASHALIPVVQPQSPLPENLLLNMPPAIRAAVLTPAGQEKRFIELFTRYPNRVIRRHWILAIGQRADSPRRVRAIRDRVRELGYEMFCGTWIDQREAALRAGHVIGDGDWVSVRRA